MKKVFCLKQGSKIYLVDGNLQFDFPYMEDITQRLEEMNSILEW